MTPGSGLLRRLLPNQAGWTAEPAEAAGTGDVLMRTYHRGRAEACVMLTSGEAAAGVVAMHMNVPFQDCARRGIGARVWLLRGRRAHLVQEAGGALHSLSVILRGGPGDLPGSVRLEISGSGLVPDDAIGLALGFDWDAIVMALSGGYPVDPARIAAATHPSLPPNAASGPVLWMMTPSLHVMRQTEQLERRRPPRLALVNRDAVFVALDAPAEPETEEETVQRFDAMPTPVLRIGRRGFAPDHIWSGLHFASARLRDALDLGPDAIRYRAVDTTGGTAEAIAADYRAFHVIRQADPVDLAGMYGHEPDRDAGGRPTAAWLLSVSGPHATPRCMRWKPGFTAPAPLFRDTLDRLVATDALADRVARAGIMDVAFQDVTSAAALTGPLFRPMPASDG